VLAACTVFVDGLTAVIALAPKTRDAANTKNVFFKNTPPRADLKYITGFSLFKCTALLCYLKRILNRNINLIKSWII